MLPRHKPGPPFTFRRTHHPHHFWHHRHRRRRSVLRRLDGPTRPRSTGAETLHGAEPRAMPLGALTPHTHW